MRDDGSLVVELEDGLAADVHHQGVDARHVVRHARVRSLDMNYIQGRFYICSSSTSGVGVGVRDAYICMYDMHRDGRVGMARGCLLLFAAAVLNCTSHICIFICSRREFSFRTYALRLAKQTQTDTEKNIASRTPPPKKKHTHTHAHTS